MFKRGGNDRFHVVSLLQTRDVFIGYLHDLINEKCLALITKQKQGEKVGKINVLAKYSKIL